MRAKNTPQILRGIKMLPDSGAVDIHLDDELGLSTGATRVGRLGVSRELDDLLWRKHQDILESAANSLEGLLALL